MMLLDLLCLLILGVVCFWVHYLSTVLTSNKSRNKRRLRAKQKRKMSKSQIKKELDNLLVQYNQGSISEQQYYERANPLIDKLSDLYSEVVWTYEAHNNTY